MSSPPEYNKAYYAANKESILVKCAEYRKRSVVQRREYMRAWRARNRPRVKLIQRKHGLKRRYGLTVEAVDAMIDSQGGKCAICAGRKRLDVDHDHSTGAVRGMLCGNCNRGIGLLGDSSRVLSAASTYLEGYEKKIAA